MVQSQATFGGQILHLIDYLGFCFLLCFASLSNWSVCCFWGCYLVLWPQLAQNSLCGPGCPRAKGNPIALGARMAGVCHPTHLGLVRSPKSDPGKLVTWQQRAWCSFFQAYADFTSLLPGNLIWPMWYTEKQHEEEPSSMTHWLCPPPHPAASQWRPVWTFTEPRLPWFIEEKAIDLADKGSTFSGGFVASAYHAQPLRPLVLSLTPCQKV